MAFDNWAAFTIASMILALIPGPTVLLVISQTLLRGKNAATMCILGSLIGTVALMALSLLGVGALLAASAALFQVVKWAGVAYLGYLGVRQIIEARSQPAQLVSQQPKAQSAWASFWAGSISSILNPKVIMFYMAFLPQFIEVEGSFALQMGILIITWILVFAVLLTGYALIAVHARKSFQSQTTNRRIGYASGGFMLGGSALLAVTR